MMEYMNVRLEYIDALSPVYKGLLNISPVHCLQNFSQIALLMVAQPRRIQLSGHSRRDRVAFQCAVEMSSLPFPLPAVLGVE